MSQIFKILFQIGDINIFVLHGVFFDEKTSTVKSETHFSREAIGK